MERFLIKSPTSDEWYADNTDCQGGLRVITEQPIWKDMKSLQMFDVDFHSISEREWWENRDLTVTSSETVEEKKNPF